MVPCNSPGGEGCSFHLLSSPLSHVLLGPPQPLAGAERVLSYVMFAEYISFCLAEQRQLPSSCTCSYFVQQLSFPTPKWKHDSLSVAEYCTAQYFCQLHQVLLSLLFWKAHGVWINALPTHCTYSHLNLQPTKANPYRYWQENETGLTVTEAIACRSLSQKWQPIDEFFHPLFFSQSIFKTTFYGLN